MKWVDAETEVLTTKHTNDTKGGAAPQIKMID